MSTEPIPETTLPAHGPNFGRRLAIVVGRLLKAFFKLLFFGIILAGVGFIVFLLVQELRRSFDVVNEQIGFNRTQLLEIGHDLGALEEQLNEQTAVHDGRIATLETYVENDLAQALAQQSSLLDALDLQLSSLISQTSNLETETSLLNEGVLALQTDINNHNGRLDTLGGELDALSHSSSQLGDDLANLQTAVAALPLQDLEQMRQVVSLFRVWEMISRARLRLLENNVGLAATDVTQALATLESIAQHPNTHPDLLPALALVQARLTLADAYLPQNPTLAALDLENSWRELDQLLATLLDIPLPADAVSDIDTNAPEETAVPPTQP